MPPPLFVDPARLDPAQLQFGPEEIRARNPHRHEMELLHGVLSYEPERGLIVGMHRTSPQAFWVRGHIPGKPLMPGVLMVELAAQLCSFYWRIQFPETPRFFGFGGIDNTRFRGTVSPGDIVLVAGKSIQMKPRRAIFDAQGFVGDQIVFETRIRGILI